MALCFSKPHGLLPIVSQVGSVAVDLSPCPFTRGRRRNVFVAQESNFVCGNQWSSRPTQLLINCFRLSSARICCARRALPQCMAAKREVSEVTQQHSFHETIEGVPKPTHVQAPTAPAA